MNDPAGLTAQAWAVIWDWLRDYQRELLLDSSRYRIVLKTRRAGISDLMALWMVLVAAGLSEAFGVMPYHCNVVSRTEKAGWQVVEYCHNWITRLHKIPSLRPYIETSESTKGTLRFARSGFRIAAHPQNPDAMRSFGGHLVWDEAAYMRSPDVWTAAIPTINHDKRLTLTLVSSPNKTEGPGKIFYEIFTDTSGYPEWSRHKITIFDAIDQGFPVSIDEIRRQNADPDDFEQEYNCQFLGRAANYMSRELLQDNEAPRPRGGHETIYLGVDIASEVDRTAAVVIRVIGNITWICERFVIAKTAYTTRPGSVGQDLILASIVRHFQPVATCIDTSSSESIEIMQRLAQENLPTRFIPRHVSKEWKGVIVPGIRGALTRGELLLDNACITKMYSRVSSARAIDDPEAIRMQPADFLEHAFSPSPRDPLYREFESVHKKLLKSGMTYDTNRRGGSHGDLFWASAFGIDITNMLPGARSNPKINKARSISTQKDWSDSGW